MELDSIAPIGSPERTPAVSPHSRFRDRRRWASPGFSNPEPQPESENCQSEDVEFSVLDPAIGAILAQVNAAACGQAAARVKRLLNK